MEHSYDIDVAVEYGMVQALLIKNFQFWIIKNRANEKHFHDGRWWTYNSASAMAAQFPEVSLSTIKRALTDLSDKGVLLKGNYNESPTDQTRWYAFLDEQKWIGSNWNNGLAQIEPMESVKMNQCIYTDTIHTDNSSSYYRACEEEDGKAKIKRWIEEAGMVEQNERVFFRKELRMSLEARSHYVRKTLDELIDQFYDFNFQTRDLCERNERSSVLVYFQNWLPKYIDTKIKDAEEAAKSNDNQPHQDPKHKVIRATNPNI